MKFLKYIFSLLLVSGLSLSACAVEVDFSENDVLGKYVGVVDIHGFISQGFIKDSGNNYIENGTDGSFNLREMGINFSTSYGNLRLAAQLFAGTLGSRYDDNIILHWAVADYHWKDEISFRGGKMKMPFGLYNETRDIDAFRTSIFLPNAVYNENYRDPFSSITGGGIYGTLDASDYGSFDYQFYVGVPDVDDNGTAIDTANNFPMIQNVKDFTLQQMVATQMFWNTPIDGLKVGGSYLTPDYDINGYSTGMLGFPAAGAPLKLNVDGSHVWAFSSEYTIGDLVLAAEYMRMTGGIYNGSTKVGSLNQMGYYGSATYQFTDKLSGAVAYSVFYDDKADKDGDKKVAMGGKKYQAWNKDFSISAKYDIRDNWDVKAELHFVDGAAQYLSASNSGDLECYTTMLAFKTSYYF